jgi:hypothetical protein
MSSIRATILKQIFAGKSKLLEKSGDVGKDEARKRILNKLFENPPNEGLETFAKTDKKLLKADSRPVDLFASGMKPKYKSSFGEIGGLYWAPRKEFFDTFVNESRFKAYKDAGILESRTIEGIPRPDAKVQTIFQHTSDPGKLRSLGRRKLLDKDADFVEILRNMDRLGPFHEIVQRKPGNVLARLNVTGTPKGNFLYRILGLAGATAGGVAAGEEEVEAMPLGKLLKGAAARAVPKGESSAAKKLVGKVIEGRTVTNVTAGGPYRYIHYNDGTVERVGKDSIHNLARGFGTESKMAEFAAKDEPSQLLQAMKSLDYHKARSIPAGSKMMMREHFKHYTSTLKEAGLPVEPTSMVRSGNDTFLMPTRYAEMLEKEGHLKILKRLE